MVERLRVIVSDGRVARLLLSSLAIAFFLFFAVIAALHLRYPYEVEWYEGLMMDHIVRAAHGYQIFDKPTVYFSAALYQPLYYYIVAPLTNVFGETYFAGRIVTILSSVVTALVAARAAYELTKRSKFAVLLSVGLFFSTYVVTDYV